MNYHEAQIIASQAANDTCIITGNRYAFKGNLIVAGNAQRQYLTVPIRHCYINDHGNGNYSIMSNELRTLTNEAIIMPGKEKILAIGLVPKMAIDIDVVSVYHIDKMNGSRVERETIESEEYKQMKGILA